MNLAVRIEVDNVAVQYDLADHAVLGVSLVPEPVNSPAASASIA